MDDYPWSSYPETETKRETESEDLKMATMVFWISVASPSFFPQMEVSFSISSFINKDTHLFRALSLVSFNCSAPSPSISQGFGFGRDFGDGIEADLEGAQGSPPRALPRGPTVLTSVVSDNWSSSHEGT